MHTQDHPRSARLPTNPHSVNVWLQVGQWRICPSSSASSWRSRPQVGAAGLTYSRLAEQAGVTRQTIYRHWPARSALLVDLILDGPDLFYPEPGTDPAATVTAWLVSLRAGMTDPATRTAVLAVTADADRDPDSAQALVRLGADRLAALNQLLAPSGRQVTEEEYTLLYGPVLSRLFFERRDVTDDFIHDIVTQWRATPASAQDAG